MGRGLGVAAGRLAVPGCVAGWAGLWAVLAWVGLAWGIGRGGPVTVQGGTAHFAQLTSRRQAGAPRRSLLYRPAKAVGAVSWGRCPSSTDPRRLWKGNAVCNLLIECVIGECANGER